ncbi:hypothetical protein PROFUN_16397 [Planoprotostelium fungivorum]|uniref:Uncharacterized protein n=1 Tax=Planoprotostelium fungivorum TaxID=1890364 RepID=A0A2P6MQX4_9EUKA|nr:hypothetical protein PROFUN_16397 [Planoprotostelium fungivorum]
MMTIILPKVSDCKCYQSNLKPAMNVRKDEDEPTLGWACCYLEKWLDGSFSARSPKERQETTKTRKRLGCTTLNPLFLPFNNSIRSPSPLHCSLSVQLALAVSSQVSFTLLLGISPENADLLFQPFSQVESSNHLKHKALVLAFTSVSHSSMNTLYHSQLFDRRKLYR